MSMSHWTTWENEKTGKILDQVALALSFASMIAEIFKNVFYLEFRPGASNMVQFHSG